MFVQDFIVVVGSAAGKVIHSTSPLTMHKEQGKHRLSTTTTAPHPLDVAALPGHSNRERTPPPTERFYFLPDLVVEKSKISNFGMI